jgi:CRISPR-associated endonuclease Cas3-HD
MVVYSFKGERLAEHSYLVLRLYSKTFGSKHERLIARRLDVNQEFVSVTMRAACLLHDVGKALSTFQDNVERGSRFPFHEVVSAHLTYVTLRRVLSEAGPIINRQLSFAGAYAVLQHHQAMRGIREVLERGITLLSTKYTLHESLVDEMELVAKMGTCSFEASPIIDTFKQVVEEISKSVLGVKLKEFIGNFTETMTGHYPKDVRRDRISEWAVSWGKLQPALPLFTAPLQLSDYLAAFIIRGGRMRALHKEMLLLLGKDSSKLPNIAQRTGIHGFHVQ